MGTIFSAENLISFIVLVVLEIVLGIDNVIFVSIILGRMRKDDQQKGRLAWMIGGITIRATLLMGLSWLLAQKSKEVMNVFGKGFDLSSIVMLAGGVFLIYKTVMEIHQKMEGEEDHSDEAANGQKGKRMSLGKAIFQILTIDTVFSFDSIITAGGTANVLWVMIAAVVIAMVGMFLFSPLIAGFIQRHPTIKMLAMSFLVMIGFTLVVEGWDHELTEQHHLKNYVYFAMGFSFLVELLNIRGKKNATRSKNESKSG